MATKARPRAKSRKTESNVVDLAPLALKRREADLRALHASELKQVNLDVPKFVGQLLTTVDALEPLKPWFAQLPEFPEDSLPRLKDYALILEHAHQRYQHPAQRPPQTPRPADVLARARELRLTLIADVDALTNRALLDPSIASSISRARNHRELAGDLTVLSTKLRSAMPRITGKCAVTQAELDEASRLAAVLLSPEAAAPAEPRAYTAARDLRARAFTLAIHLYADVSRAVRFLAPAEADELVPSPYARRSRVAEVAEG